MERIKQMGLKSALFTMMFTGLLIAAALSAAAFCGCVALRGIVAPSGVELDVHASPPTITWLPEPSSSALRLACILEILQIVLPIVIFTAVTLITSHLFYCIKLKEPLKQLRSGAEHIMENNLDFTMAAPQSRDELGQLCAVFESMRQVLLQNNRELWRQSEERKRLNAAFSHDLRNPVTVLKGSAKMAKQCAGKDGEQNTALMDNLTRIETYANRIEQYIEAMSKAGRLEQLPIERAPIQPHTLTGELEHAIHFIALDSGKSISFESKGLISFDNSESILLDGGKPVSFGSSKGSGNILLDKNILFQIAENLVSNALRFANQKISVEVSFSGEQLSFTVSDDGCGFPSALLKNGVQPFQKYNEDADHFGMGLYICDLLCKKHGGCLTMQNTSSGASVCAVLNVSASI